MILPILNKYYEYIIKEAKDTEKEVPYLLQLHIAYKAGTHIDLRIKHPKKDTLYSFVLKKPNFIKCSDKKIKKDKVYLIRTFNHSTDMLKEKNKVKTIPKGEYGGGKIITIEKGNLQVIEWNKKRIIFHSDGKYLNGTYKLTKIFGNIYGGVYYTGSEIWIVNCGKK